MSDAERAIDEARILTKKAAAAALARKESLEADITKLEKSRGEGDDELRSEMLEMKREELALAETHYQEALAEMRELERLKKGHERDLNRAVVDGAIDPSHATNDALERVRHHARELDATAELNDELAGKTPARKRSLTDEEARAQLNAMKAGKTAPATPEGDDPDTVGPKKKRTL